MWDVHSTYLKISVQEIGAPKSSLSSKEVQPSSPPPLGHILNPMLTDLLACGLHSISTAEKKKRKQDSIA